MRRDLFDRRRASFLAAGDEYERARPSYPEEAVRWVVGDAPRDVVDLGCGPGKLAEVVARLGHRVVGVDPSVRLLAGMAARRLPSVCGAAEVLPLRDACCDAVVAGQAFHWFDHRRAVPEMRRIVGAGGRAGLLWNLRDERVDWVRRLSEIIGSGDAIENTLGARDRWAPETLAKLGYGGSFEAAEHRVFAHEQDLDEELLADLVASRSYVAILGEEERRALLDRVRRLCRDHPDLAGSDRFRLPYQTHAFRAGAAPRAAGAPAGFGGA